MPLLLLSQNFRTKVSKHSSGFLPFSVSSVCLLFFLLKANNRENSRKLGALSYSEQYAKVSQVLNLAVNEVSLKCELEKLLYRTNSKKHLHQSKDTYQNNKIQVY